MQNLEIYAPHITEAKAVEAIFDACRANPERATKRNFEKGTCVSFTRLALDVGNGQRYEACLRDAGGVVVALATIDDDDI